MTALSNESCEAPGKGRQTISKRGKTLDDVARLARVSPITVSRALRHPHVVSKELRQRIDAAVSRLAYVPNLAASRLASARSHAVGVIVPTLYNVIFAEFLRALHDVFLEAGLQVVVVNSRYSIDEEENAIRTLLGQRVEAMIIVGVDHTPLARRILGRAKVPVIETFELTDEPIDINIGLSQKRAGADATRFLIDLGHRRIGFMLGHLDVRAAARLAGYRLEMEQAGLADEKLIAAVPSPSSIALGSSIMASLFEDKGVPEALFCIDDNVALGALLECRRRGLRLPEDISIIGFHDLEFAACASPSLSSVATHRYEMGRAAAQTVIDIMSGGRKSVEKVSDLGYSIVARESTGPAR